MLRPALLTCALLLTGCLGGDLAMLAALLEEDDTPVNRCPTLGAPDSGDGTPFTVSGTVTYEDRTYDAVGFTGTATLPVRFSPVQVVRCKDGAILASGTTDAAGTYSLTPTNSGTAGVYVRVLSTARETGLYQVQVTDLGGNPYAVRRDGFIDSGVSAIVQDLHASAATGIGGPFNILDTVANGIRYVDGFSPIGGLLPPLTVVWQAGRTSGTYYESWRDRITLIHQPGDTDEYDDMVILHEVGHYLATHLSRDDTPGGAHALSEIDQDARLAWSEGWGNFFCGAAAGTPNYLDTDGVSTYNIAFSMENGWWIPGGGSANELAVAATLWDGLDTTPAEDPSALGMPAILAAFFDLAYETEPATFGRFWHQLRPANGAAALDNLEAAAFANSINLAADPGADDPPGNDDAAGALVLAPPVPRTPTQAVATLAYYIEDKSADVDFFRVNLTGGTSYTILTGLLSDGADTMLSVIDSDGMTVLAGNDNRDGALYTTCNFTGCPPNDDTLASELVFVPAVTGDYLIRVERSPNAPASAGAFGEYTLQVGLT